MIEENLLVCCSGKKTGIFVSRNEQYGVKTFCEELNKNLCANGCDCQLINCNPFSWEILLKANNFDVIILNLSTFWLSVLFGRKSIIVLHGFPNLKDYSLVRFIYTSFAIKVSSFFSKLVLSNSGLTKEINEKFFRIKSDFVWNPSLRQFRAAIEAKQATRDKAKPSIIFAGRISNSKGFDIFEAHVVNNSHKYSKITVVGPDKNNLTLKINRIENVHFWGAVSKSQLFDILSQNDIFISLNFLEPYGLIYEEAKKAGCIVVCPIHCGFAEINNNDNQIVKIISSSSIDIDMALISATNLWRSCQKGG